MSVQMNIKSFEAKEIATRIAEAKGQTVTQAVLESLREAERALKRADQDVWWENFLEEGRRLNAGRVHEDDPTAFLYDELGLPK